MHEVNVGHKTLADYRSIVPKDLMTEIDELGERLKGRQVLHVNATAFGGGVAEILYTLVPLVSDVGLEAHWQILTAPPEFFNVTKSFHNGLQGHAVDFPPASRALYEDVCRANAAELTRPYDFVVIHDPQPLMIRDFVSLSQDRSTWWIWRCHIDTSTPDQALYDYLVPSINRYDAAVYTLADYVPPGLTVPVREIAPTIDPLAPKNMQLSAEDATYIVRQFGIDVERPLLAAGLPLRPLEGPAGGGRRLPRRQGESTRTCSSRSSAPWPATTRRAGTTSSASSPTWAATRTSSSSPTSTTSGSVEINAFQSHADVIMQKSTREGFGLTVTEGLWKGRPVIGGAVGGIPLQIEDGVTGYLVHSAAECAERCLQVMADPARHREMALRGKEKVRREFLTPRLLRDDLRLFADLESGTIGA